MYLWHDAGYTSIHSPQPCIHTQVQKVLNLFDKTNFLTKQNHTVLAKPAQENRPPANRHPKRLHHRLPRQPPRTLHPPRSPPPPRHALLALHRRIPGLASARARLVCVCARRRRARRRNQHHLCRQPAQARGPGRVCRPLRAGDVGRRDRGRRQDAAAVARGV